MVSTARHYATCLALCVAGLLGGCSDSDSGNNSNFSEASTAPTDTTAPVITLNGNETIEVAFGALFGDLGASAVDDVDGEVTVSAEGSVDTQIAGTYEITYRASDASGNTESRIRTVIVLEDPLLSARITNAIAPFNAFFDGILIGADYWTNEPEILSAGYGFDGIIGLDAPQLTFDLVREADGSWSQDIDCGTDIRNYTSASLRNQLAAAYEQQTPYGEIKDGARGIDGLPIVFSWPVDTSTVNLSDFQVTLNTGDIVKPLAVSPFPNQEHNERNTIPIFGEWGNRLPSSDPNSRFPVKVEIVADETPLMLVGPGNVAVSAVGLSWENTASPYDENNGPRLVGAKLNRIDGPMQGEGPGLPGFTSNDASVLYDEGDFQLRMLTSGGYSPDGVSGVRPDEFERYFRVHATGTDGNTVIIDRVGQEYQLQGGRLRVVGLADLGQPEGGDVFYDDCYDEDYDNYIDIVLVGDEAAARSITYVEVPSLAGGYSPLYNPGGPGRTPFEDVAYSSPGPADLEPVTIALDDPMRVTYNVDNADGLDQEVLTLEVDGVPRQYLLNVPEAYSGNEAVPLLFDFHQIGGTAQQQFKDSQLDSIAERENFILVTPQAVGGVWTVTGFPISNDADDFGFVDGLIDELKQNYNIDADRIYATGMSQGAFLAFDLACNFSDIFAAIAPVSGAMSPLLQQECAPERPLPVLQTHGTADDQIPYGAAEDAIDWWVDFNNTSEQPEIKQLPDPFPENGTTVESWVYENTNTGVNVEHFRINGGGHVWPGSEGDSDINMAEEIWRFLSRFDLEGAICN
jgi:poly(3-hydroxybutyrate) depolymerase